MGDRLEDSLLVALGRKCCWGWRWSALGLPALSLRAAPGGRFEVLEVLLVVQFAFGGELRGLPLVAEDLLLGAGEPVRRMGPELGTGGQAFGVLPSHYRSSVGEVAVDIVAWGKGAVH